MLAQLKIAQKPGGIEPHEVEWNAFQGYWNGIEEDDALKFPALSQKLKSLGGFKNIKDYHFRPQVVKEALEIAEGAKINRKEAVNEAKTVKNYIKFEQLFKSVFEKVPLTVKNIKIKEAKQPSQRVVHGVISDLHIGSDVGKEYLNPYGKVEEARGLAQIAYQIGSYKEHHRKESELSILLLGDIIEGLIHNTEDQTFKTEQICRAIWSLGQFFEYLLSKFSKITVWCTPGNHDRDERKNPGGEK